MLEIGYTTQMYNYFGVLKSYTLREINIREEIIDNSEFYVYDTYRFVSDTGSITLKNGDDELLRILRDIKIDTING